MAQIRKLVVCYYISMPIYHYLEMLPNNAESHYKGICTESQEDNAHQLNYTLNTKQGSHSNKLALFLVAVQDYCLIHWPSPQK